MRLSHMPVSSLYRLSPTLVQFAEGCGKSKSRCWSHRGSCKCCSSLGFEKGLNKLMKAIFAQLPNTRIANLAQEG